MASSCPRYSASQTALASLEGRVAEDSEVWGEQCSNGMSLIVTMAESHQPTEQDPDVDKPPLREQVL